MCRQLYEHEYYSLTFKVINCKIEALHKLNKQWCKQTQKIHYILYLAINSDKQQWEKKLPVINFFKNSYEKSKQCDMVNMKIGNVILTSKINWRSIKDIKFDVVKYYLS